MTSDLENAKVGDYVAERGGWSGTAIHKISHVTPTQIVTGDNRWAKRNGKLVGSSSTYHTRFCRMATKDDFLAARIEYAQRRISQLKITAANVGAAELLIAATVTEKAKP